MCGIVGLIDPNSGEDMLASRLAAMAACVEHRGPDHHGQYIDSNCGVALGHQRLSIQDLSPLGNQPMSSSGGRYVIVFNGEIYNFRAIATELVREGVSFKGRSDTEVLLAAIESWGLEKAVEQCEGMFAFALWDIRTQKLHLCRDRIGEKPLYFGSRNGVMAFASELKSLHEVFPHSRKDICPKAFAAFCRYGYVPAPYSINKGIYKLPQGCIFSVEPGMHTLNPDQFSDFWFDKTKVVPYWSAINTVQQQRNELITDPGIALTEMDSLLRHIIKQQLIADVPIGAFLSGGIDSTLVAAIAQQESVATLKTFTIGFRDKSFDEAPFAKRIADTLGTEHYETYVDTADILDIVNSIPEIYCEPHANPSVLPSILVSRIARQQVKVCLSGDGGDELFGGYNRYLKPASMHNKLGMFPLRLRKMLHHLVEKVPLGYADAAYRKLLDIRGSMMPEQSIALKIQKMGNILRLNGIDEIYEYLVSTGIETNELICDLAEVASPYRLSINPQLLFEERAMLADQLAYLPDDNLAKVDRASMSCSLETRLPLLSHRLLEFSWRLPLQMKIKQQQSKWLLRELLAQQIPRAFFERPKMGFSVPVSSWLRNELKEWMLDLLNPDPLRSDGLFNPVYISKLVEEHLSEKRDHANKLWTVLTFQAWYKR